jgi:hypothetical protein
VTRGVTRQLNTLRVSHVQRLVNIIPIGCIISLGWV